MKEAIFFIWLVFFLSYELAIQLEIVKCKAAGRCVVSSRLAVIDGGSRPCWFLVLSS